MAKIDVTRTELVWAGKYNDDGTLKAVPRVSLPFQVIETVNESRATRETKKAAKPSFFDIWEGKKGNTFEDGWRNKRINHHQASRARRGDPGGEHPLRRRRGSRGQRGLPPRLRHPRAGRGPHLPPCCGT